MTRLLRHDPTVLREEDGAVEFRISAPPFHSKFKSSPYWSIRTRLNYLQKGGGAKKRFQYCVDPYSAETILYFRAIQGPLWRKNTLILHLQDNMLLPSDFAEHIYHVGSSHDLHSIIQSGLIPGVKEIKKRETCGVLHGREPNVHRSLQRKGLRRDEAENCSVQTQLENTPNTVCGCNLRVAQSKGLQFCRTRSNGIILYNTLPALCIEKEVIRKSGEELYSKTYQSPAGPQRIVLEPKIAL